MGDADIRSSRGRRDRSPAGVAPLRVRLLTLQVERWLRLLQIHARRCEERDARLGQALCERRPDWFLLAGKCTSTFVDRAKCPRQELEAVDDHRGKIMHVVVPCARSFPVLSAMSLPSAVASLPPRYKTLPSQRMRPVSRVIGRTKLTLVSRLV